MNAVVDSSPELESTVLEMADEIAGQSFIELSCKLHGHCSSLCLELTNLQIQINLELTQSVVEAKSIQDREHSEIRNVLQTIVKSSDDMKALLSMQSSPGSRPVEDMMERLQTVSSCSCRWSVQAQQLQELMDPMLQSNKTEDYKAGLWLLHEKTSKLPPLTDLTGQIQWASLIPPAQGQFSEVYKGQWLDRETVALRLPRALINNPQIQHNFQNEVSIWRTLEHPNVIPIYGVVYVEETMYTVSPWMDNGTATIYVKKFPEVDRLKILTDVASGLEYLHNKGVIHGDLRGENVLISANGVAHVAEFGQSKFLEDFEQNAMAPHSGPLRWTAPEMLQETGSLSTHSDIWSYGMLCLEILSEELPYNNIQRDAAVLREIDSGHLPKRPVRATAHGLSDGMWTLLRKCWQQRPESRPSISEVRAQLLKLQGAQSFLAENKPHFSMLKDRQKGRELQSSSSTTSTNSSTSNLDVFSEKATSSILDSRLSTGRTNLTSLPSSAVPTRPLSSDDGLLRLSHYSSDSIAEPLREALSDSRIVVDVVDGAVRRGTLEGLVQHLITTYNHNSPQDIEYRYLLLVACPDFTSPENLFIILSRRFHEVESDVDIRAEDKITWQYNIFTVIMYWLSEQDLKVEYHLLSRIKSFCEDAARIKASATMVNRARDLLQLVETRECRKLRNFSSLVAIATALHSSPIERLRLTRLELSMQVQNKLGALKDILDVSANHRSYREALEEGIDTSGKGPCIPWLAIHLKELHAVLQRYPVVLQVDGRPLINFERYTKFMDRIKEAVHYTPPDMERYRQQRMLEYIENELLRTKLANITEEDLVTRSKKLEAQEMMERRSRKSQLRHLGFLKM
ncbi:hypothetical protein CVT25_006450 [Psilocybe cyanescens]|uniref:Uncharacterized protein n=1 Tax=Psilocybe cyanescens TaxID=93625 RepID=A0A409XE62_PSICY|nr:hypothetical protein CVT25_006450 [Psilocybe cyanescens]